MQKYLSLLFLASLIFSCASVNSYNKVIQDGVSLRGGTDGEKSWSSAVKLQRTSWFNGVKMVNDIFIGKLDKDSDFKAWFGNSKDLLESQCSQFYVALIYTNGFRGGSRGLLRKTITDTGLEEVVIPDFTQYLRTHPIYQALNLENHRVSGFCAKSKISKINNIDLIIPGFKKVNLL